MNQNDSEMGTYSGELSVLCGSDLTILASITFVPLDEFRFNAYDNIVTHGSGSINAAALAELAKDSTFLSVVTTGDPYIEALRRYGPGAALNIFYSIHEWGVLQALHLNPSWYRNDLHAYIDDSTFEDQVLYHEDLDNYLNSAGHIFGSEKFNLQIQAEQLISELAEISIGNDDDAQQHDAAKFEEWCKKIISVMLGNEFDPVLLHPNGLAFQRRDIIATNLFKSPFGIRINHGFGVQHLVFEIKNKKQIKKQDVVQTAAYLNDSYGRLGFVIYRSDALVLDPIGAWRFRSIALVHRKHIVELTTGKIVEMLRGFSTSGNSYLFDLSLRKLLDIYEHNYINEPMPSLQSRG